jgi:hypothetical protein
MTARLRLVLGEGGRAQTIALTAWDVRGTSCLATVEQALDEGTAAGALDAVGRAVASLFQELGGGGSARVELRILPPLAQMRTLRDLPPVRGRDLVRLVREQRERFFRDMPADSTAAARWDRAEDGEPVTAAALVDSRLLEVLETAVERAGARIDRILATKTGTDDGLALATPSSMKARNRRCRRRVAAMATLMLGGWSVPVTVYVADLARDNRALRTQLSRVDTTLALIDSLDRRVAAFTPIAEAFRRQSPRSAWAAGTLAEVAQGLPPSLHLHSLIAVPGGTVTLRAHSSDDVDATGALDARWPGRTSIEGDASSTEEFTILLRADG